MDYPLALAVRKLGWVLVPGNAYILKAHEFSPLSGLALVALGVGLPPGLFNVVTGDGHTLGRAPMQGVNKVTMTGSTRAGREIYAAGAAKGAALWLVENRKVPVAWNSDFTALGMKKAANLLPWTILIVLVVVAIASVVVEGTSLGRTVLAIGGNAEAAHLVGLKTRRAEVFIYLFSGVGAGLAGVFLASSSGAGQPQENAGRELAAIAAVVVGGTLVTAGMGSVPATVAEALQFGLLFSPLNFENGRGTNSLSANWRSVIRGPFFILAILLQAHHALPVAKS